MRLLCVFAHPDDEALGAGGILAKYAAEGVETFLITATRGEHGWFGAPEEYPGPQELGRIREAELMESARVLGIKEVTLLDYEDGHLDQAEPWQVIDRIVGEIRRIKPDVVVTFDLNGAYGHPDHIAISQYTNAAAVLAADATYQREQGVHRVSKLYYFVDTARKIAVYQEVFGELVMNIDGVERRATSWEDWAITTVVRTEKYHDQILDAIRCHRTQLPGYEALTLLPVEKRKILWDTACLYRAYSFVNGGRAIEDDLFAGIGNLEMA
ncbi:MAG: PIG-L family deacetylase [Chloroflexi bacterium]|nr:PIG-L family deacetylase [Chloroflexota bacterium]